MKRKITCALIVGVVLLGVYIQSAIAAENSIIQDYISKYQNQEQNSLYVSINDTQVETTGPLSYIIHISEVEFIEGPVLKLWLMSYILTSTNMHFFLPYIKINVNDIAFLVTYTKNTVNLPLLKRLDYKTSITIDGNVTNFTDKHTVVVSGFSGIFYFSRVKPIRLQPATFGFSGTCNEVLII